MPRPSLLDPDVPPFGASGSRRSLPYGFARVDVIVAAFVSG